MTFHLTAAFSSILTVILLFTFFGSTKEKRSNDNVLFYPAYGYSSGDDWVIPIRVYVYEYRPGTQSLVRRMFTRIRGLNEEQAQIFNSRIRDFVVDSESRETVLFSFDDDPQEEVFGIPDGEGSYRSTGLNGFAEGELRISKERMKEITAAQNPADGWLTIRAVSDGHPGEGRIKLIEPEGHSVISDVDDTVKITELPAGSQIVIRNTFYKEYVAAPDMAEFYHSFGENTAFHYVSGSPWQLFRPLSQFLFGDEAGFPEGTFHMKSVTKNFLSLNTWRDLRELVMNEDVTFDQKITQISQILEHFPQREFILIGDSGEADPEVFSTIREMFPDQVREIYIRDVVNARELAPERLEDMHIIPAPTIVFGSSQFDELPEE
ncbi:MAG: App1 family protein [Balneolaceae bacterium]|nr:App1 family protein [Balneolaceae bacterium]